jgi:hypothetical protein
LITAEQKVNFIRDLLTNILSYEGKTLELDIEGLDGDDHIFGETFTYKNATIFRVLLDVVDYIDDAMTGQETNLYAKYRDWISEVA